MPWVRLLPRLLLVLCLVLNGIGASMASLRMPLGAMAPVLHTAQGDHAKATAATPDHAMASADHCNDPDPVDCCAPDQCDDACTQIVPAVVVPALLATSFPEMAPPPGERPTRDRVDPPLPHPVRPPIA
ncbi:CopL family metal-binding regulatory protein [Lysobacter daejeonensis]